MDHHENLKRAQSMLYNPAPEKQGIRKTKTRIICTIGPKSNSVECMKKLLEAGMCVVRMNTAHGDFDFHQSIIDNCRKACSEMHTICALLLDIKGPEIRTCELQPNPSRENKKEWQLQKGQLFTFTTDKTFLGNNEKVACSYQKLPQIVKPKVTRLLVADGLIGFQVISTNGVDEVTCIIENNAILGERKNMNIPGEIIDLPAVTKKDMAFVDKIAIANKIDFIAGSFIRKAQDIKDIRALPGVTENGIKIIAKIENQEGIDNFDEILEETDGVMVARGDLGVEIALPKVSTAQKMMIQKCNYRGKSVITATQMLESMITNPRPTRAEVADVFNAVVDGTDCVMLSGETANGNFPVESVKIMNEIAAEAESTINYRELFLKLREGIKPTFNVAESVASSAVKTSWDLQAGLIVALSETGNTARLVSKYRPHSPILCVTKNASVARQLLITRGVYPYVVDKLAEQIEQTAVIGIKSAMRRGFVGKEDFVIVTSGAIQGESGTTSMLRVAKVDGEDCTFVIH